MNSSVGTDPVRTIRVLAVGAAPAPRTTQSASAAVPEALVRTRETASPGYKEALAAHQAVASPSRIDPSIAEAVERQTRAMCQLSRRAFPESETPSADQPAPIEAARLQRRRESEVARILALRRARAERAARQAGTSDVAAEPAPLRTTA
ncbi:hypothetical protein AB5J72_50295 [Streptomyces sp. CG1]|uniref:hypothetical protein n=1 Tax=Streptomyces sp. CG1 TaxID=1287523 RepID=UPI0034E2B88A